MQYYDLPRGIIGQNNGKTDQLVLHCRDGNTRLIISDHQNVLRFMHGKDNTGCD